MGYVKHNADNEGQAPDVETQEQIARPMRCVANLDASLLFVSDSQDVDAIRKHFGVCANSYDSFFVGIRDGDYTEVWGMCGIVPLLSKLVSRLR